MHEISAMGISVIFKLRWIANFNSPKLGRLRWEKRHQATHLSQVSVWYCQYNLNCQIHLVQEYRCAYKHHSWDTHSPSWQCYPKTRWCRNNGVQQSQLKPGWTLCEGRHYGLCNKSSANDSIAAICGKDQNYPPGENPDWRTGGTRIIWPVSGSRTGKPLWKRFQGQCANYSQMLKYASNHGKGQLMRNCLWTANHIKSIWKLQMIKACTFAHEWIVSVNG